MIKYKMHLWVLLVIGCIFYGIGYTIDHTYIGIEIFNSYPSLHNGEIEAIVYLFGGIGIIALIIQGVIYAAALCTWITEKVKGTTK